MKRVYTFYQRIPELKREADELALLALWHMAWERAGYRTAVLTMADAEEDPQQFEALRTAVSARPTYNSRTYSDGNHYRWLALVNRIKRECSPHDIVVMSDYDVVPFGFDVAKANSNPTSVNFHCYMGPLPVKPDQETSTVVPCLASGTIHAFEQLIPVLVSHPAIDFQKVHHKHPHCSDQYIFTRNLHRFVLDNQCAEIYTDRWERGDFTAVHYPNGRMMPLAERPGHWPKWQYVADILNGKRQK